MSDLIDRQATLSIIEDVRSCISVDGYWAITERIKALPSAERKKGEWIKVSADKYRTSASYVYKCKDCGEINWYESYYCPDCGARMEAKDE